MDETTNTAAIDYVAQLEGRLGLQPIDDPTQPEIASPLAHWTGRDSVVTCIKRKDMGWEEDEHPMEARRRHVGTPGADGLLDVLPDNVGILELWGGWYENGVYPGPEGYAWIEKTTIAAILGAAHKRGLDVLLYVLPSHLERVLGPTPGGRWPRVLDHIIDLADFKDVHFDGIYLDGLGPRGYEVDPAECFDWYAELFKRWTRRFGREPVMTQHSSGRREPSLVELQFAERVLFGEHGGPVPAWSPYTYPKWSTESGSDWTQLDRTSHPQFHTYAAALRNVDVIPMYKMASCHQYGRRPGYPDTWPTGDEWTEVAAVWGAARVWVYHPYNVEMVYQAQRIRDAYATPVAPMPDDKDALDK